MKKNTLVLAATLLVRAFAPAFAAPCELARIAYAPGENLEAIDVALIDGAKARIDIAAYVLTDIAIVDALSRAAQRGVVVRLYRDGRAAHEPRALNEALERLRASPNAEVRYKTSPAPLMHLKAYAIDNETLREGAGNFTHSGLKRQDNSLLVLKCDAAVKAFEKAFQTMWER